MLRWDCGRRRWIWTRRRDKGMLGRQLRQELRNVRPPLPPHPYSSARQSRESGWSGAALALPRGDEGAAWRDPGEWRRQVYNTLVHSSEFPLSSYVNVTFIISTINSIAQQLWSRARRKCLNADGSSLSLFASLKQFLVEL